MTSMETLLVRHLPNDLNDQEKIDLLCHFGAKAVRPMGTKGTMKHTAFAKFQNHDAAEKCLRRLHQLEILGCKLVVEFAQSQHEKHFPTQSLETKSKEKDVPIPVEDTSHVTEVTPDKKIDDAYKKHNILYPKKPTLNYMYPPPTVSTLTNIANALASHPKFYTQVLHLMNKMNLPCPFGPVTASPPLALESARYLGREKKSGKGEQYVPEDIEEVEMEYSSSEESEIESDADGGSRRKENTDLGKESVVRKKLKRPRKRMRLIQPDMSMIIKPVSVQKTSEVFEATHLKTSQIQFKISEADISKQLNAGEGETENKIEEHATVTEGGFGKVEPQSKPKLEVEMQKTDVNYKIDRKLFLNVKQIEEGRLKKEQMKDFSVFKKYSSGDPTSRLYIKNLTKHTTEQDLMNLFGSFIDWSQDLACEAFDIRLMKEGRMKGQAFVTLPNENEAVNIVKECNGFILNNKPIVIQFARSAKAKQLTSL
ncbi:RNA-binding region-containing protein 3-like [Ruditapes philippinarum]|uniref:RNA-binding region-containing protein 3-like n=1 Tax=Ruditapes philippinarum TaxID=129788 RepID=UPI00295BD002|nr:RNA-binding region-containing protein 3-like [Ruditapes philippinarum]